MQDATIHASPGGANANASSAGAGGAVDGPSPHTSPNQPYTPQFHQSHMMPYSQATYAYPTSSSSAHHHLPVISHMSYHTTAAPARHHHQQHAQLPPIAPLNHPKMDTTSTPEAGPSSSITPSSSAQQLLALSASTISAPGGSSTSSRRGNGGSSGGGKTFTCTGYQGCNMSFSRSEHLARHVRKHTGEKPFTCRCGKKFTRLDNLRQHASTIHSDEPEANEELFARLAAHMPRSGRAAAAAARQKSGRSSSGGANNSGNAQGEVLYQPPSADTSSYASSSTTSPSTPVSRRGHHYAGQPSADTQQQHVDSLASHHDRLPSSHHAYNHMRQHEPSAGAVRHPATMPAQLSLDHKPAQQSQHTLLPRPLPSPSFRFPAASGTSTSAPVTPAAYPHPHVASSQPYQYEGPSPVSHYSQQSSDFNDSTSSVSLASSQHHLPSHHAQEHQQQQQYIEAQNSSTNNNSNTQQPTHPSQAHNGGRGGSSFRVTEQQHPQSQSRSQQQPPYPYTTASGVEYTSTGPQRASPSSFESPHIASQDAALFRQSVNASAAAGPSVPRSFTSKPTLPSLSSLIAGEPLPTHSGAVSPSSYKLEQPVGANYARHSLDGPEGQRVHSSLLAAADAELAMHRHSAPPLAPLRRLSVPPLHHQSQQQHHQADQPTYDSRSSSFSTHSSSTTSAGHTAATSPPPVGSPCSPVQAA